MGSCKGRLAVVSHNLGIKEADSIKTIFSKTLSISDYAFIGESLKRGELHFALTCSFCFGFDDKNPEKFNFLFVFFVPTCPYLDGAGGVLSFPFPFLGCFKKHKTSRTEEV